MIHKTSGLYFQIFEASQERAEPHHLCANTGAERLTRRWDGRLSGRAALYVWLQAEVCKFITLMVPETSNPNYRPKPQNCLPIRGLLLNASTNTSAP